MRSAAAVALFFLLPALACARPTQPDLSTEALFRDSCAALPRTAAALSTSAQRQAFAICRDVELVQNISTFLVQAEKKYKGAEKLSDAAAKEMLRAQLTHMRDELRSVRLVLEKLKLGKDDGLTIKPAAWQLDLNGDAETKTWEKYFFAIPKRGHRPMRLGMPSNEPDYYQAEYQLDAAVHIDQSDIAWALSYHYFAEALVETVLSYTLNEQSMQRHAIELVDPAGMKRANALMVRGFKTSEAMRRSVLAEKDDHLEWIGNVSQKSSVFPLPLDGEDFKVWGTVMGYVIPLFEGRTLLVPNPKAGGMLGFASKMCPSGQGLNVTRFYSKPPRYPVEQFNQDYVSSLCERVDKAHPASGLFDFMLAYGQRAESEQGAGMLFLRQLLWVN